MEYCLENARKDKRLVEQTTTISNVTFIIHQFNLSETRQPAQIPKFVEIITNEGVLHMQIDDAVFIARS